MKDLFEAAIHTLLDDLIRETRAVIAGCPTASDKLRRMVRSMLDFSCSAEGLLVSLLNYWASQPERRRIERLWLEALEKYRETVVEVIQEGIGSGEFCPNDTSALAWAVMAAYDGLIAYAALIPDLDLEQVSKMLLETLLRGLQCKEDLVEGEQVQYS